MASASIRIFGYAIISAEGMIADASGRMPEALIVVRREPDLPGSKTVSPFRRNRDGLYDRGFKHLDPWRGAGNRIGQLLTPRAQPAGQCPPARPGSCNRSTLNRQTCRARHIVDLGNAEPQ